MFFWNSLALTIHILERSFMWLIELQEIIKKSGVGEGQSVPRAKSSRDEESENARISGVLISPNELNSF